MEESYPYHTKKGQQEDFSKSDAKSQLMLFEKIVSIIPVPYYWGWAFFAGTLFVITSICLYFENSLSYLPSFLIFSIMVAQQPIIIIWAYKRMKLFRDYLLEIIELPRNIILNWYEDQIAIIFNPRGMLASGAIYTIILYFIDNDKFGFAFKTVYAYIIYQINYILVHLLEGSGIYVLLCTAIMVHRISKLPMNARALLSKNLKLEGALYSKFTIYAISIYVISGCFILSTPLKLNTTLKIAVYSFIALLLLAYAILPQYSIYKTITRTKKEKLEMFSNRLSTKAMEAFSYPTKDNITCLRNFLEIEHRLDEACAWPFGSYEILHMALIVIIPFVVVLIEIMFKILK